MASPSSSSMHKRFKYDVFLSFRGIDTRTKFVDHLYYALQHKGIHTYKDDERIKKGKKISDELIGSIQDSKFYIIVFSKNYASSSWCLDELVKIMECHKTNDHTAYPLFYDVEPTEVRHQCGAVKEAFAKHEDEEDAVKWRMALKEAADLSGWELKNSADRREAKFIQKVVEEISLELRGINFNIDEKLVGMETRVNDVLSSVRTSDDDAHVIGIKGMGGGGKTTLARAIFDQISFRFEGKSFVENVREVSKASLLGLKSLQNQIFSDVFNDKDMTVSSVHEGVGMMKKMMPCKKVIIILDDVDHREQLKALAGDITWFKPGSVIIITTRDRQVLEFYAKKSIHDVQLLSDEDAMCLFRRYAFGKVIPNPRYEELSRQFVKYAAGLPLAIEVLGSFLCGKDELEWRDAFSRLKTIPSQEILKVLEISYSDLEEDFREIFLNVACFLKGWQKDKAIKALESCKFNARSGLRVLELKSLITVDEDGRLGMHDHIVEMGMNIVRRSHPDNPNKHSRLWIDEEIKEILANDLGTEATRYIQFMGELSPEIVMQGLGKMKELRFLCLLGGSYDASESWNWKFSELPNALRYLCWKEYPFRSLPTTFQADNLVSLKMPDSRIVQLWEGGEKKVLSKLRFLNLSNSQLRTFDLGVAPNLETLDLGECEDLIELLLPHRCLSLRSLKLNDSKLKTLDIGLTPNLEYLDVKDCYDLEKLHMADGCLEKLVYLDLSGCLRFRSFKFDIDDGSSWSEDDASCSEDESVEGGPLAELHLIAVSVDECYYHPDSNLPKFLFECYYEEDRPLFSRNLEKLISVGLCVCTNLDTLSRSICGLQHLRKFTLQGSILEAPKDLDQLEFLQQLDFSYTKIQHLPDNICMLKHLKSINLYECSLLEKLPEELGQLECLQELDFSYTNIQVLPGCICKLKHLKSLSLDGCSLLQKLPEDLGQLECLKILNLSETAVKELPDGICLLKHLESLDLDKCSLLQKLPENLGQLQCLKRLNLSTVDIKYLPDSICMLQHLDSLDLSNCSLLEKLPEDLGQLECLKNLDFSYTNFEVLPGCICKLKHLESLSLDGCSLLQRLPENLGQLECLKDLNLRGCELLREVPDSICNIKCLKHLNLEDCIGVAKLPEEIGSLECLESLYLQNTSISHLPQSIFLLKGLRIAVSRGLLQSCGFPSEMHYFQFEDYCFVTV